MHRFRITLEAVFGFFITPFWDEKINMDIKIIIYVLNNDLVKNQSVLRNSNKLQMQSTHKEKSLNCYFSH